MFSTMSLYINIQLYYNGNTGNANLMALIENAIMKITVSGIIVNTFVIKVTICSITSRTDVSRLIYQGTHTIASIQHLVSLVG